MRKKFYYYTPLVLQKIVYVIFYILHHIFVKIEIRGRENLKGISSPVIFASNHTSELDVTAIPMILPFFSKLFPIFSVADPKERFNTFGWRNYIYGGVFFHMLGAYSIYSGHRNYAVALEDHIHLLLKGKTVFIFPEGKRTLDGVLNPARGGLGYMVYVTGATVVPIAIDTFFNINSWEFFTRRRKVVITICEPMKVKDVVSVSNPTVSDFRSASQKVLDRIEVSLKN